MKRWKAVLAGSLAGLGLVVLGIGAVAWRQMQPTRGQRIDAYARPQRALLVLDIQEDFTGPDAIRPYRDGARLVESANLLLAQARDRGIPVVFIQNVIRNPIQSFFMKGANAPGAPGTRMDRRLLVPEGSRLFSKERSDAFGNPGLDAYLRARQVDELCIVGLDAAHCVKATTQGALNRGYRVVLFPGGLATESGNTMASLLQEYREAGAEIREDLAL